MRVAGSICIKEFYLHIFLPKHQRTQNGHILEAQASSGDGFYFLTTVVVTEKQQNSYSTWKKNLRTGLLKYGQTNKNERKQKKKKYGFLLLSEQVRKGNRAGLSMTSHRQLLCGRGKHFPDCISLELLIICSNTIWVLLQDSFYGIIF